MNDIPTTNIDVSHHIQRQLLLQLRESGALAYATLKPDGLEGNAYNYHLRGLKRSGLVELKNGVYQLTSTGHLVSDAFSFVAHRLMLRPHFYTTLLVTQGDEVLVYVPAREPLAGRWGLPSGKLHYGDSFAISVTREMERRGLDGGECIVKELCPLTVRYLLMGETVVHRPGFLWHVDYKGEKVELKTERGASQWLAQTEVTQNALTLPELAEGLQRLKSAKDRPIDLDFRLD